MLVASFRYQLLRFESRYGIFCTVFFASIALLIMSGIYFSAHYDTGGSHGEIYAKMSSAPFVFLEQNDLQYRILTPLLAHFVFLRGNQYFIFPVIMGVLFLSSVFYLFRHKLGYDIIQSFFITSIFAFSSTIFVTLHWPGLVDTTSYFMLMLCLIVIDKRLWFVFFALSLLNHQSNLFIAPALTLLYMRKHYNTISVFAIIETISYLAISLLPFILWRYYVNSHISVVYDFKYYFSVDTMKQTIHNNFPFLLIGLFMSFKLIWYIPLKAFFYLIKNRDWYNSLFFLIAFTGVAAQLLFAEDITRLMSLAFIGIIMGIYVIKEYCPDYSFTKIALFNLLVPTLYVTGSSITTILPLWLKEIVHSFVN